MVPRTGRAGSWQAAFTSAKTPCSGFWRKPMCARIGWNATWPATIRILRRKAADVIGLYLTPPQHAAVFCVDEKTAIQALDRLDPVLPLSPGRAERHGFEYYRTRHAVPVCGAGCEDRQGAGQDRRAAHQCGVRELPRTSRRRLQTAARRSTSFWTICPRTRPTRSTSFLSEHPNVKLHFTPDLLFLAQSGRDLVRKAGARSHRSRHLHFRQDREFSVAVRKSEAIALGQPSNASRRWLPLLIRLDRWHPVVREERPFSVPANGSAQTCRARRHLRRHAKDLDSFTLPEWRDTVRGDALRPERKTDLAFQIVVPAHCLLFRAGIDDGFVVDAVFADRVSLRASSSLRSQDSAHRGAADLQPAGDLSFADAGAMQFPDLEPPCCRRGHRPAQALAILPGLSQASASSLAQDLAFELGEDRPAVLPWRDRGRGQIQRLGQRNETDAEMLQFLQCRKQIRH